MTGTPPLLEVAGVSRNFEALQAVREASFTVAPGTVTCLIGPNGAGKTTMFNLVAGVLPISAGRIDFEGRPIHRLPSHRRARAGLGRTFQDPRIFREVTVRDQILAGFTLRAENPLRAWLRDRPSRAEWQAALAKAEELMQQAGLQGRGDARVEDLSFGEQRFLSIARVLAGDPRLVLMDEPSVGLDGPAIERLLFLIRRMVREEGRTVLLVEHNMKLVYRICDHLHLMVQGTVVASGSPAAMRNNAQMIDAYLGTRHAALRH